jgi:hypothetical protein
MNTTDPILQEPTDIALFGILFFQFKIDWVEKIIKTINGPIDGLFYSTSETTLRLLTEQALIIGGNVLSLHEAALLNKLLYLLDQASTLIIQADELQLAAKMRRKKAANAIQATMEGFQNFEDIMEYVAEIKETEPDLWPEAIGKSRLFMNKPLRHPEQKPNERFMGNYYVHNDENFKILVECHPNVANPEVMVDGYPSYASIGYPSKRYGQDAFTQSRYSSAHVYPVIRYLRPVFVQKAEIKEATESVRV